MEAMIEELKKRGFSFGRLDDTSRKTITVTFDDGYYNNILFEKLAQSHDVPYLMFTSAYYNQSGNMYPWFQSHGGDYSGHKFPDYYEYFSDSRNAQEPGTEDDLVRPMTFAELDELNRSDLVEIGCHGYFHQPLSQPYEQYLSSERDLAMACLKDGLSITPRYFSLANGAYTKRVMSELLESFERVFTIEGRPYRRRSSVVDRITLLNPTTAGPLTEQIDRHLKPLRQIRRTVRSFAIRRWS